MKNSTIYKCADCGGRNIFMRTVGLCGSEDYCDDCKGNNIVRDEI